MSVKSTFKLTFLLNRSKANKEGCPIILRVTMNGERISMNVNRRIKAQQWNVDLGRPIVNDRYTDELSMYLETIRNKAFRAYNQLSNDYDSVTPALIRDFVQGKVENRNKMIIETWNTHNTELEKAIGISITKGVCQKHKRAKHLFEEFIMSTFRVNDIPIRQIQYRVVKDYFDHLLIEKKFQYNTCIKQLQYLKKITNNAKKQGWIKINPFADFPLTSKESDRGYLDESELNKIIDLDLQFKRLDLVRDIFLFSCFTGLAYIDVKNLKKGDLEHTSDGLWWIKTRRQKTNQKSQIPLLAIPKEIIDRYCELSELKAEDTLLPVLSNQKLNAYLKEIADLCQIEKNLTFHVARHTFATTVTLQNGVSIESVSRMLGHSNIKTTQHYARIVDKKIAMDMEAMSLRTNLPMAR